MERKYVNVIVLSFMKIIFLESRKWTVDIFSKCKIAMVDIKQLAKFVIKCAVHQR